jgi:purine-binding chemotaxis protein CheW
VDEVIPMSQLTAMAMTVPGVAGLLNVHGDIVPVVDIAVILGPPRSAHYSLNDYIILLKNGFTRYGVIVSEIVDIKEVSLEQNGDFAKNFSNQHNELPFVSHIVQLDNQIIFILNSQQLYERVFSTSRQINISNPVTAVSFAASASDSVIFIERAEALAKDHNGKQAIEASPLIVISLNQEYFGIEPEFVKEFTTLGVYTPFPAVLTLPYLLGFINIRGEILTLIDLWPILRGHRLEVRESSKALVVVVDNLAFAILIDDLLDVIPVKPHELGAVPLQVQRAHREYIKETVIYKKEVIGVMDMAKVIEEILRAVEIPCKCSLQ